MAGNITSIAGSFQCVVKWNAQQAVANAATADQMYVAQDSVTTTSGNFANTTGNGINSIDQGLRRVYSINANGNSTIDLSAAFTNIVGNNVATFARIKGFMIRLLSITDDATLGTAAGGVLVGNSGSNDWVRQGNATGLGSATSTLMIKNGGWAAFCNDDAAGTLVDSTHKNLFIVNQDTAVAATVQIVALGSHA